MTQSSVHASDFVPRDNPCAQCGKPIAKPSWSEPGNGCISYVWSCWACDYEFTCIAVYPDREEEQLAA